MSDSAWRPESVLVAGFGVQTPVGRKPLQAAAAVRCGISAYGEHPFMIDRRGEPMVVAMADWLDEALEVEQRIVQLGSDALLDAVEPHKDRLTGERLPLVLALSSRNLPREAQRQAVAQAIAAGMAQHKLRVEPQIVADENAAGVLALAAACQHLREGHARYCLVLGADSHLGLEQLDAIDAEGRLHSINNSWGFTPGEGAAAVLLCSGREASECDLHPLAEIAALATGREDKLLGTQSVCIGQGLTQAFRGALSDDEKVAHSYCDLNGETYRADEFGFAVCRTSQFFEDAARFTAAAECWGDVGAASATLQVALAAAAWQRGYARGPVSLCWASSGTSPLRGAVRLRNSWSMPAGA